MDVVGPWLRFALHGRMSTGGVSGSGDVVALAAGCCWGDDRRPGCDRRGAAATRWSTATTSPRPPSMTPNAKAQ